MRDWLLTIALALALVILTAAALTEARSCRLVIAPADTPVMLQHVTPSPWSTR